MDNYCEVKMKKINEYQFMTHLIGQVNRSIKEQFLVNKSKVVFLSSTQGHLL